MLFIKSLHKTTCGEDIFNHIMQYCNDKDIPLTNLSVLHQMELQPSLEESKALFLE